MRLYFLLSNVDTNAGNVQGQFEENLIFNTDIEKRRVKGNGEQCDNFLGEYKKLCEEAYQTTDSTNSPQQIANYNPDSKSQSKPAYQTTDSTSSPQKISLISNYNFDSKTQSKPAYQPQEISNFDSKSPHTRCSNRRNKNI